LAAFYVAITLNFFIPRWMPGDPATQVFASLRGKLRPDQMEAIRKSYGFDGTLWDQYLAYLGKLARLDFGVSTINFPEPTSGLLFYAAIWTLLLVGLSTMLSFVIGIVMGIYAASHRGGFFDSVFTPINVQCVHACDCGIDLILCLLVSARMVSAWACPFAQSSAGLELGIYTERSLPRRPASPLDRDCQFWILASWHAEHDDQPAERGFRFDGEGQGT
jgi:ABC-type dipeptide/oligopeptide/nickel transport system permease component